MLGCHAEGRLGDGRPQKTGAPPPPSPLKWNARLSTKRLLALPFVVSFCFLVFHAFLALTNMTTHEFLKADSLDYLHNTEDFDLPFSRGFLGNLRVYVGQDGTWAFLRRRPWAHVKWTRPSRVDRDSEDWWRNPWQNKYWSCC